jgi:error-prone DNA polymerase
MSEAGARRIVEARHTRAFRTIQDLFSSAEVGRGDRAALAGSDALRPIAGHRYRARWDVAGIETPLPLLPVTGRAEGIPLLKQPTEGQDIVADYKSMRMTLRRHPMALLRTRFESCRILSAGQILKCRNDEFIHTAGLVITRQRPGSANGVFFVTLEDETGYINLIVWESVAMRQRRALLDAALLRVSGNVQRQGDVLHVIATQLTDWSRLLGELSTTTRNFR